jgi:hypothetical protein
MVFQKMFIFIYASKIEKYLLIDYYEREMFIRYQNEKCK